MISKSKTFAQFLQESKEYFIRSTTGRGEMKIYHLIDKIDFSQLDIYFQSREDTEQYAKKHELKIIEYKEG